MNFENAEMIKKNKEQCDRCYQSFSNGTDKVLAFLWKEYDVWCSQCYEEVKDRIRDSVRYFCPEDAFADCCPSCQTILRESLDRRQEEMGTKSRA